MATSLAAALNQKTGQSSPFPFITMKALGRTNVKTMASAPPAIFFDKDASGYERVWTRRWRLHPEGVELLVGWGKGLCCGCHATPISDYLRNCAVGNSARNRGLTRACRWCRRCDQTS